MNQQKRGPLLLVILAVPLRLQNPPLDLSFRTIKEELLSCVQGFALQLFLGEPRELVDRERLGVKVLGIIVPGIVRSGELIESSDDVDVVRLCEGVLRVQETTTR